MEALNAKDLEDYKQKGHLILDTRDPANFAEGFIPESLNVPFGPYFEEILENWVMSDRGLLLVSDDPGEVGKTLREKGYDNLTGFLEGGFEPWMQADLPVDMVISIDPHEFSLDYKHDEQLTVYDLRDEAAIKQAYLDNAVYTNVDDLLDNANDLNDNITYYFLSEDGSLAMTVVSMLKQRGRHNLYHIQGGFQAVEQEEKVEVIRPKSKKQDPSKLN